MQITCPHCSFSREIPAARIPQHAARVLCTRCGDRFPLWPKVAVPAAPEARPAEEAPTGSAAAAELAPEPAEEAAGRSDKAGFCLRAVATFIDGVVYVGALALLLAGFGAIIEYGAGDQPRVQAFMWLLALFIVLAFGVLYRVFFIGYCGQTPGKMATRIKVVRTDGSEVGFLAAIFREVLGKFISQLLFCAGFLMVVFDEQKQGLHDKIADTYVIKL